ncbi:MAG: DUF4159 domain-containing protein [Parvularculaceae bacterium]|nr:DUF4159 domain-containing protein [Parvularculaceae bacterium]
MGALSFSAPFILAALVTLPAIWFLLRVTPPAPARVRFPAFDLLRRLQKTPETPNKTPWPILLLRLAIAALSIFALSGPILNAPPPPASNAPLLIVVDDSWIAAAGWRRLREQMETLAEQSSRAARPLYLLRTAGGDTEKLEPVPASDLRQLFSEGPSPFRPDYARAAEVLKSLPLDGKAEIAWYADGIAHEGAEDFYAALAAVGTVTIRTDDALSRVALAPPASDATGLTYEVILPDAAAWRGDVVAIARDGRELGRTEVRTNDGEKAVEARLDLPLALQNDLAQVRIDAIASTGAVQLVDARRRRALVGFIESGEAGAEPLLSGQHYVRKALEPYARFVTDALEGLVASGASAIVLDNVGRLRPSDDEALTRWIEGGGVLIRFSGPQLAEAAEDETPSLVPVALRGGGRAFGGALTWETPQALAAFGETGPFFDLSPPSDVFVRRQILAEPGAETAERTWASLGDGTPLVTGERRGAGALVLFHVTATPEWSDLPLSPMFVDMLRRLIFLSALAPETSEAAGDRPYLPLRALDGYGALKSPPREAAGATLAEIAKGPAPGRPPGLYGAPEAPIALNAIKDGDRFDALAIPGASRRSFVDNPPQRLAGPLVAAALFLFALDAIVALFLSGRLRAPAAAAMAAAFFLLPHLRAEAQPLDAPIAGPTIEAALQTRLGYVRTGDPEADRIAEAGLQGLTRELVRRTSLEPAEPAAVDPETDDLSVYQFLYWPIVAGANAPSDRAVAAIETFMRFGGLIVFDTRDDERAVTGTQTPERLALQTILRRLDLPALTPLAPDHVLLRSFYLLSDLPGRMLANPVWVQAGGGPNDSVTPIIIGGRDWAGAWASDELSRPLFPMAIGGERARGIAMRAGVNMAMVAFTGNYKLDQVHTPILLERLGRE